MAFPIPSFDDDESQEPTSSSQLFSENPFISQHDFTFDTQTHNNLRFDQSHPLFSSSSCVIFASKNYTDPPRYYALKSSSYIKRIRNEYEIFKLVGRHQTIITCFDYWVQTGRAFLQLELASHGSIRQSLFQFNTNEAWTLVSHVAFALSRIHSLSLMHLDVSPSNILHCQSKKGAHIFKLTDFGTALPVGSFTEDAEGAGPYVSPEALGFPNLSIPVGTATDIFSFGVVMLEVLTQKPAPRSFPGYENLRNGSYDLSGIPREFDFIKQMLSSDPIMRPTAQQILGIERVDREIKALMSIEAEEGLEAGTTLTATPSSHGSRLPPETPYSKKYVQNGRKLVFDDDL